MCLLCCTFWPLGDQFHSVGNGHAIAQTYSTYWRFNTTMKIWEWNYNSYLIYLGLCILLVGNVDDSFLLNSVLKSNIGRLHHMCRNSFYVNLTAWPYILSYRDIVWMISLNYDHMITFHYFILKLCTKIPLGLLWMNAGIFPIGRIGIP